MSTIINRDIKTGVSQKTKWMKATKQPTVKELRTEKTILLRHIVKLPIPEKGFRRMYYCTELDDRPGKVYFGLSYRRPLDPDTIEKWVEGGYVIEPSERVVLPYEKDVWLHQSGKIYILDPVDPQQEFENNPELKPITTIENSR